MKILVLVKEVPDTYADRSLSLDTGLIDRGTADAVLDEIGERALEVALQHADSHADTEVVLLSMAPGTAATSLRKGLAMGAGSAVQVVDIALAGADLTLTAETLAAALRRIGFDLVIAGDQSTDGAGGVLPAMLAELLAVPAALNLQSVEIEHEAVQGVARTDFGTVELTASLPAIVSITEALPDARFPNFKGILAAKKKSLETLSLADLEVDAHDPGAARSIMTRVAERTPRQAGSTIVDGGDAGERLAEFLVQNRLA
ncbi:electron transfer flavoprotein subunit beta/FixA family protein [Agrococcus baldri]|uniref:Electron transfer flavoprotein subunit beta n=1 Tax=Agrococcus baldri TaxID=153730 RepID=A0AA87REL5_9MICO|nr:electron transfer flavoprotein subunit beta/FixA family protein [Agrococcus baldri]GEK81665.1 electron transfer flavoprotein subunit beta [Agrococcus baldri]